MCGFVMSFASHGRGYIRHVRSHRIGTRAAATVSMLAQRYCRRMIESFWEEFVGATGIDGPYEAWAFGDPSLPDLATKLALLVRDGPKRATAGLASDYEDENEPLPEIGDLSVILDGEGSPVCVIRTTAIETRRFGDVDETFAWDEGEGDRSLEWWRRAHLRFFERQGTPIDDDTLVVLEHFKLLWPTPTESTR